MLEHMSYMWPVGCLLARYMRLELCLGVSLLIGSEGVPISEIRTRELLIGGDFLIGAISAS